MMDSKILLVIILMIYCVNGIGLEWSFSGENGLGPNNWNNRYPNCSGPTGSQSPIDIPRETFYNELLTPFKFHGYHTLLPEDLMVENKGKKVEVAIKEDHSGTAYFTGGGYADRYNAVELHFHWGINDTDCAGHALHGECYPLELHVVHRKENYTNTKKASEVDEGLAVFAFLFRLSEEDNEVLTPYLDALKNVTFKGQKEEYFAKDFHHFMGGATSRYYRYHGSMGYPPCHETISWTVFEPSGKHTVSTSQLGKLREIYQKEKDTPASSQFKLTFNHRPLQALGTRKVEKNFKDKGSAVTASFGVVIFSIISLLIQ